MILFSLLSNMFILTFDMSWGPHYPQSSIESNLYLIHKFIYYIGLLSGWLPQKLILFSIFFIAGYGAFSFVQKVAKPQSSLITHFAGVLYIFNPFVYTRLMAGQWLVLIGYALLPWVILSVYKFIYRPTLRNAGSVLIWMLLIGFTSIHTLPIVGLTVAVLGIVALAVAFIDKNFWLRRKKLLLYGIGITAAWLVINLVWLIPLISGKSSAGQSIDSFASSAGSSSQLEAFATHGTIFGSPALSALGLTGFWADGQGRYLLPSGIGWPWYVAAALIIGLALLGAIVSFRRRHVMGMTLAISGLIAFVLAIGIASPVTAPLTLFLNQYVPLYAGFREPQKWLMLLALSYAYLGAVGLSAITARVMRVEKWSKLSTPIVIVALILPIVFAPNLAWGAGGQLQSVQYPAGWQQAAEYLNSQPGIKENPKDTTIVVLPWHMYLHVDFVGRVVANPARYYFPQNIIVGDNPELRGVPPLAQTDITSYIGNTLIPQRNYTTDAGLQLKKRGVQYVMVLKEADYNDPDKYGWVQRQTGFTKVLDNESLTLYKVSFSAKSNISARYTK